MAAHIPEARRAIAGRTHDRCWQPEAVEITRRTSAVLGDFAIAVLAVFFAALVVLGIA